MSEPFWERKTLEEMTPEEWESLCDGCGRCCLHRLEDEETGEVATTRVSCWLFDEESCRCGDYEARQLLVPGCVLVTPALARVADWLPASCAYRRLARGRGLAWWHPLVSGRAETVHEAGISVRGKVIGEDDVDPVDLVDWITRDFDGEEEEG